MKLESLIRRMTLEEKVGQIITFEFIGWRIRPDARHKIEDLHCGGLRITPHINEAIPYEKRFDRAFAEKQRLADHCTPERYAETISELQKIARRRKLGLPLHISIDQEGDFSCDYARGGVHLAPSAMGVAATGDLRLAFEIYRALGRQLRSVGATMVHSPVLDVNSNPQNPEICTRSFGDDPEAAAAFAEACMKGYLAAGIMPTAKHFPGRGASAVDLHHALDDDPRALADYEQGELRPYVRLIAKGLPAVMMSHQICPAFGDRKPATVAPALYRYLRETLGFEGVITTDAMGMKGVLALHQNLGHACAEAAAAGADLVLAKCHPALEDEVFRAIKRYVEEGRISGDDLNAKVLRVLRMKERQGLFKDYFTPAKAPAVLREPAIRTAIRGAAQKSALLVRNEGKILPLKPKERVLVVEPFYREWQAKGFDNFYHPCMLSLFMEQYSRNVTLAETDIALSADEEDRIVKMAAGFDKVVVNTFFWRGCPTNSELIRNLIIRGVKVVQVATAPYNETCVVDEVGALLVTWGQVPECQRNAAGILYGKAKARGKWPLKYYKIRGIK